MSARRFRKPKVGPRRKGALREFFYLLTLSERNALFDARDAGDGDNILKGFLFEISGVEHIDLDDPDLAQGLAYVSYIGVLTELRVVEILGSDFNA